jgi:hypothetical protein
VSTLHITNGDSAAATLREFIADPVTITADILHDGPAPDVGDATWYAVRARHLADGNGDVDAIRRNLEQWDLAIQSAATFDETILWFEHDLFDQLQLIRTLDRIPRRNVSLICIDRFPGVSRFIGLGQLSATELASLVDRREAVTTHQFEVASRVWAAFRADNPTTLVAAAREPLGELPYLRGALLRFLAEYPSTFNGVSLTVQHALEALDGMPLDGGDLFRRIQEREQRPFMCDSGFFRVVRGLARGPAPLVHIEPDDTAVDLRGNRITMTEAGVDVLKGRADAIKLNGIDQWLGGVQMASTNGSSWRWDPARQTLTTLV